MSAQQSVMERVKFLENIDYETVKHHTHFEWVVEYEKTLNDLASEVFDTLGVNDETSLNIAVSRLEEFLENLGINVGTLVEEMSKRNDGNEAAMSFAVDWRDNTRHHIAIKYHRMGDGPTAATLRWAFTLPLKMLTKCATHLASLGDSVEFKKWTSEFERTVLIGSLMDTLRNLKSDLEARKNSSS